MVSEDPLVGSSRASSKQPIRFVMALSGLMLVTSASFIRGAPKPQRPPGEPARWKLVVWFVLLFTILPAAWFMPILLGSLLGGGG